MCSRIRFKSQQSRWDCAGWKHEQRSSPFCSLWLGSQSLRGGAVFAQRQYVECTTVFSILSRIPQLIFHWPQMLCFGVVISCKLIGFERQQGGWLDGVVPHPSTPQDCSTSLVVAPAFCNLPSLGSLELVIVTSLAKMTVPTVSALAQGPVTEESWWKRYRKGWCEH